MRGLKKLLALLLAITMIASVLAVPVFAADDEETPLSNGAKLELLGLLIGDGDGVTAAYLAKSSTRMQLAILNARWLDFEQEAYDYEDWDDDINFVDYDDRTSEDEWNMLAYYYADPDLGFIGIGYDVFDPQANITNKQLAKILLVAMGYPYGVEYDWDDILLFAADLGINFGSREVGITNSELADAMVAALEALSAYGTEDEPMTFAQYLMDLGVVTEDDLKAAGIAYVWGEEAPGAGAELPTLEVASAKADNFAEVELTFNQKVDPESVDYAVVKIDNLNTSSGAKVYVVDDYGDGKVVRIFEPEGFVGAQNEYRTISLTGLKTPGGISMTAFAQQITFRDSAAPSIEKVVAKGNTRLDVYFSEPLYTADASVLAAIKTLSNYQVGGKSLSASGPTINDDADENTARMVTIKNIKTSLSAGVYVLGVLGTSFKDFAGNTLGYQTAEFEIVADTEGPIAQKVLDPVYQYKVMIEFDEEIQDDAEIRWVEGSKTHTSDKTTVKDNVATFEFTSSSKVIPIGGTTITLVNARDYWNNAAQQPLSFDIVPVADTLRPAVVSYGADTEGEIWIKFNKSIAASSINLAKWVIKNGDDDTTYDWGYTFDADKDDKKITIKGTAGGDALKAGLYKITIKDIKDTVLPTANTILDVTIEVDVPDTVAPDIVSATWGYASGIAVGEHRIINIFFSEEVDYSSSVTRGNYRTRVAGESYKALPNNALIGLQPGNRTVTITMPAGSGFDPAKQVEVSAIDIQDLYGNRSNDSAIVGNRAYPSVKSIKATAVNKIEVEFTSEVTAYDATDFTLVDGVRGNTIPRMAVDTAELNGDGNKATLVLTNDLLPNAQYNYNGGNKPVYLHVDMMDVNEQSQTNEADWLVVDGIDPSVLEDSYFKESDDYTMVGNTSIFILFNEQLQATTWNNVFDSIKLGSDVFVNGQKDKDGYIVTWNVTGPQAISGTDDWYLTLTFVTDSAGKIPYIKGSDITFTYNAHPDHLIKDVAGNTLGGDAFNDIKIVGVRIAP